MPNPIVTVSWQLLNWWAFQGYVWSTPRENSHLDTHSGLNPSWRHIIISRWAHIKYCYYESCSTNCLYHIEPSPWDLQLQKLSYSQMWLPYRFKQIPLDDLCIYILDHNLPESFLDHKLVASICKTLHCNLYIHKIFLGNFQNINVTYFSIIIYTNQISNIDF